MYIKILRRISEGKMDLRRKCTCRYVAWIFTESRKNIRLLLTLSKQIECCRSLEIYGAVRMKLNKAHFMYLTAQIHKTILLHKNTNKPLPIRYIFTINETFQMRYCMKFYLKGHQKYNWSNFWLSRFTLKNWPFWELLIFTCNFDAP